MENGYNPSGCGWAVKGYGVPICRLETLPCAVAFGKECCMEQSDKAVEAIGKIIHGEEEEKES